MIDKLHAYGFSKTSLKLIFNYLNGRKQRTKINNCLSTWPEIIYDVPQGSLDSYFSISNDLCFSDEFQMANFADDNTPYDFGTTTEEVIDKLEKQSGLLIEWHKYNYLVQILGNGISF